MTRVVVLPDDEAPFSAMTLRDSADPFREHTRWPGHPVHRRCGAKADPINP